VELIDRKALEEREDRLLAPYGMRSGMSRGRRHPEPEDEMRTRYQRDRDRVIHSSSFRRLEYKTQVFVNHEGDNYRTRLTHSLEGAQIGRSVARTLGLNEELTECLVLGHDLGHTPFGHSGERAMDELMEGHGGFEHNQQTLRILEVLEERYPGFSRTATRAPPGSTRRAKRPRWRRSSSISWTRSPTTTTTSTTAWPRA